MPMDVQVKVYLSMQMHHRLRTAARRTGQTMSALVEYMIDKKIDEVVKEVPKNVSAKTLVHRKGPVPVDPPKRLPPIPIVDPKEYGL
jgi:hypothetical protein